MKERMITMAEKIVQTAGRDALGEFAPEFAHFNDDILFGENWNNQDIDLKTRCIITVVALISRGVTDSSLKYHLTNAKNHGVTQKEMAAIITHISFYSGWPLSWAAFNMAKEVYDETVPELTEKDKFQNTIFFPVGEPNPYGQFFDGQSYLAPVSTEQVPVFNVTFEPGCRNHYHIHHAKSGGGQMLICVGGRGYYQEEGREPVEMTPGKVVNIPANVKHWHGAAPDSWFAHLAIEVDGEETSTEWLEPVSEEEYRALG
jgi:4-carboxymuconolactone decarboxylase